ncbi:hypothetical protein [Rhizobium giardinii]
MRKRAGRCYARQAAGFGRAFEPGMQSDNNDLRGRFNEETSGIREGED